MFNVGRSGGSLPQPAETSNVQHSTLNVQPKASCHPGFPGDIVPPASSIPIKKWFCPQMILSNLLLHPLRPWRSSREPAFPSIRAIRAIRGSIRISSPLCVLRVLRVRPLFGTQKSAHRTNNHATPPPSSFNVQCWMFDVQRSNFRWATPATGGNIQRSTLNSQRSTRPIRDIRAIRGSIRISSPPLRPSRSLRETSSSIA